jgi:prepilin-type N-terminal cleavage/methylation domain-containing protein
MSIAAIGSQRRSARRTRSAFTLIEILVVVAIIALLISILLPSLARSREMARRAICAARLHNMSLAVTQYAHSNRGKIIQCRASDANEPMLNGPRGAVVQVAIDPRIASRSAPGAAAPDYLVDWQGQAKRYQLDKEVWECPNREGTFGYEGTPSMDEQGYTAADLRARGYRVTEGTDYDQWIIGFQYFGGIKIWENAWGKFKSRSPIDANSKPHWVLAADSNMKVDGYWGGGRPSAFGKMPPHPAPDGKPEGGNVLTFDGAVRWIVFRKMIPIHSWEPDTRQGYWYQADLGDFAKVNPH